MNKRFRSISTRIFFPIIIIISALALFLYVFLLRTVSGFADNFIKAQLEELRKDVHSICDLEHNSILFFGKADDEQFVRVHKGHVIAAIEDFAFNSSTNIAIRHENRFIFFSDKFPADVKDEQQVWSEGSFVENIFGDYYVSRVIFEPWEWEILLFKDKKTFSLLIKDVQRAYALTIVILVLLACGLFFYMDKIVARPLKLIAEPVRHGNLPSYEGTSEFEFLSNSIRDMMQRLQEEAEIRISEEKLRSLIETILVGVAVTTPEGAVLEANETLVKMLGYDSREEIFKRPALDHYYDPEERANVVKLAKRDLLRGYEFRLKRKDGSYFWASMNMVPHYSNTGLQFICSLIDISARKIAEEELIHSHSQLKRLSRHLTVVRENERKKVAREIHDELGQELTALNMYIATLIAQLPDDRPELLSKAGEMSALVNRTMRVVQRLVNELRPGTLDTLGLRAAIETDVARYAANTNIAIFSQLTLDDESVPEQAVELYRIWQEAMTNVMRHSGATEVRVKLLRINGNVVLEVIDNGKGMDNYTLDQMDTFGIIGMRERASMLDGSFYIGSNSDGTTVRVEIPCV